MPKWIRHLDHPVLFAIFITAAVVGTTNIAKWGADRVGLFGLKATLPQ